MSSLEALFSLCFLSFPCDSAGTLSNMSIINQVERTNSTICSRRCTQSWDQYNTAILISFRNFVWVISTKILVYKCQIFCLAWVVSLFTTKPRKDASSYAFWSFSFLYYVSLNSCINCFVCVGDVDHTDLETTSGLIRTITAIWAKLTLIESSSVTKLDSFPACWMS